MKLLQIAGCCAAVLGANAFAQSESGAVDRVVLDEVLVAGELASPALWRVSKTTEGGEHVLWILGEPPPFGSDFVWSATRIERLVAASDEVLFDAQFDVSVASKGFDLLRALTLAPALLSARKNPDGGRLQDLLPADLYARWLVQKKFFLGNDRGVERWRPMFAADELVNEAMKKLAVGTGSAGFRLRKFAKELGVATKYPAIALNFELKGLRPTIKEFSRQSMNDIECFAQTIAYVEALVDREVSAARAQAWASGDLDALQSTPVLPDRKTACQAALAGIDAVARRGVGEINERLHALWLDSAEQCLANNRSTVALLPLRELLEADGRLAMLKAKGYSVTAP